MAEARSADLPAPFLAPEERVRPEWVDRNGHMNLAYYVVVVDHAVDVLFEVLGIGENYTATSGGTMFAAEAHMLYERELLEGEAVQVSSLVLAADAKRLHLAHEVLRVADGARAATQEVMLLHVDTQTRRTAPFRAATRERLDAAVRAHTGLKRPPGLGRRIAMPG